MNACWVFLVIELNMTANELISTMRLHPHPVILMSNLLEDISVDMRRGIKSDQDFINTNGKMLSGIYYR
jgi:hypothetical protein